MEGLNQVVSSMNSSFVTCKQCDPGQVTLSLQNFDVIMDFKWDSVYAGLGTGTLAGTS